MLTACNSDEKSTEPIPNIPLTISFDTPAADPNDFAFRMTAAFAQIAGDENLVISPFSAWLPLAALANATDEQHIDALMRAIGTQGLALDSLNQAAARMLGRLTGDEGVLRIANAVFVDDGVTLCDTFARIFADYFGGKAMNADFGCPSAVELINEWANRSTDGLIQNIVNEFPPDTVAVICNAIHFKG
jgi:serpin B